VGGNTIKELIIIVQIVKLKTNKMNFEINGKVIVKEETQAISDKFKKREFVIEVENERNSE
jgi:hypothetical protein